MPSNSTMSVINYLLMMSQDRHVKGVGHMGEGGQCPMFEHVFDDPSEHDAAQSTRLIQSVLAYWGAAYG